MQLALVRIVVAAEEADTVVAEADKVVEEDTAEVEADTAVAKTDKDVAGKDQRRQYLLIIDIQPSFFKACLNTLEPLQPGPR